MAHYSRPEKHFLYVDSDNDWSIGKQENGFKYKRNNNKKNYIILYALKN